MKSSNTSLDKALEILGSKWTLPIVLALLEDKNRFNEIQRECEVCPRTLSARLDELESNGIVKKKVYSQNPPRVEYSLTKKGESLSAVIKVISDWSYSN
ncbi:MAG: helix-turn-helix domain-containing protein [Candidatus Saccharibacteria bacterium]